MHCMLDIFGTESFTFAELAAIMWERGQLSISAHIDTIVQTKLTRASGLRSIKIIGQRVP